VANFARVNSAIITLITPEPIDGIYKTDEAVSFLRQYGYADKIGIGERINFGGVHKTGIRHPLTNL